MRFDSKAETDARLALLYEIGRILASAETMKEAAPQILEAICGHLGFELGELWRLRENETVLRLESVWHLPSVKNFVAESWKFEFAASEDLSGNVWTKNVPLWIENLSDYEQIPRRDIAADNGLQSGFAFPITLGEKFLGAFCFFSTESHAADDTLLQMFAAVGSHIGQFIKREKIESDLRASEDRYRAFVAQSTEGIWRFELNEKIPVSLPIDEQTRLAFERGYLAECNDAMARMYGLERAEELTGSRIADLLDMSDAANFKYLRSFFEANYNLTDAESHEKDVKGNDKYFLNSLVGTIENGFLIRVWGTQRDITEQKRVERTMRESENQLRVLTNAMPALISYIDSDYRYRFVNRTYNEWFGHASETVVGKTMSEALGAAAFENLRPHAEIALAGKKEDFETEIVYPNGGARFIRAIYTPDVHDGRVRGFFVLVLDISDRKRAEQRLVLLAEISELARTIEEPDELLFAVARAVGENLEVRRCLFNEIDLENDRETVHRDFCRGVPSVAGVHRVSDYSAVTSAEMRAGKTVVNRDSKIDARTANDYAKIYEPNGERAYVAVPLLRENQWVASLWISDDEPRDWSEQEIALLETVAERTWTAIEKLRINKALRQSEEKLRESDAILQTINQSSPTLIYVKDRAGRMLSANPATLAVIGKTLAEVVGKTHAEYSGDEIEGAALAANDRRIIESGITETFEEKVSTGGKLHTFISTKTPYRSEQGEIVGLVGVSFDITERKEAEQAIRESEERFRQMADHAPVMIWVTDSAGFCHYLSQSWYEFTGQTPETGLGFGWLNATHPNDLEMTEKIFLDSNERRESFRLEYRLRRADGSYAWAIDSAQPRFGGNGEFLGYIGSVIDITERKLAEEKLRASEEHLQLAVDISQFSTFDINLLTDEVETDRIGRAIYGFAPDEPLTFTKVQARFHPEDRDAVLRRVAAAFAPIGSDEFEVEQRIVRTDGETRWIRVRGRAFFEGAGEDRRAVRCLGTYIDITTAKRAEESLRESEERYRTLFETMDEGFCLCEMIFDRDGKPFDYRFLEINPAFEKMTGLINAEGKTARELIPNLEPHWFELYGKVVTSGEPVRFEDGSEVMNRWFDVNASPVGGADSRRFSVIFTDITGRKRVERERGRFLSVGSDLQIVDGFDGRFKWVNPAWERTLGWTYEEMTTIPWREFLHPDDLAVTNEKSKETFAGLEILSFENRYRHKDGSYRWLNWRTKTFLAENLIYGVATDITKRKEIEMERERLLASEQQARGIAEEANRAKDEFIALVSHELRSPLNAMLGWTRILQNQNPDEKTRDYALEVIVRNARSQSRLIEDLLDIARVSKGKLRLELQPTELIPIINAAIEIIKPAAEAANIEFSATLDETANFIFGDVDRLRQVIDNLLSNAVKFTAPGGTVEINLQREDGRAKIVVKDTGQGISEEFLPQIFERFKQADHSTTRRHGGLGIGLSLARDLVELHGGAISATSEGEGKGATFTVLLPLRAIKPFTEDSDTVKAMNGQGKLSGFWILAVDDEADARELVSFMLQINGAKVTTANSAVEALDILKSSAGRLPDVLLSDISMPNESGYALLEKVRALPEEHGGQIPAVALTAFSRPEDREAAYEAGFQKHLGKPVEPDVLIAAIIETASAKQSQV